MEKKNNTPYTIEESGTLSHPNAGLNESHLKTTQTEFELGTSCLHPICTTDSDECKSAFYHAYQC